jgi:drug/metabolite transporter (DMT)-like permease
MNSAAERQPYLGALLMCLAMFMGSAIDISVKALADGYTTGQIVFLRSVLALPLVLLICHLGDGLKALLKPRWGWQLYRGLLTAGANFGFFYALAHLPLVTAVLLAYVSPVLIVLLARPLLGELVTLGKWLGICVAVAGVLVVVRPTEVEIEPAVWAIFASALSWALLSLSNRKLAGSVSSGVLTFYTVPISALIGGLLAVNTWVWPDPVDWLLFATAGMSGGCAHMFAAMAYRRAPAASIAPFEYTTLIWTALAGYLFWNESVSLWIAGGGLLIIFGGYLSLRSR